MFKIRIILFIMKKVPLSHVPKTSNQISTSNSSQIDNSEKKEDSVSQISGNSNTTTVILPHNIIPNCGNNSHQEMNNANSFQEGYLIVDKKENKFALQNQNKDIHTRSFEGSQIVNIKQKSIEEINFKNESKISKNPQLDEFKQAIISDQSIELSKFFPLYSTQSSDTKPSQNESYEESIENSIKINSYDLNKDYLKIRILNLDKYFEIKKSHNLFCSFSKDIGKLDFDQIIYTKNEENFASLEVIRFVNRDEDKKYIVKRYLHNMVDTNIKNWMLCYEEIIREGYREYLLMKLYSMCPFSVVPKEIQFAYIESHKFLIIELLMNFGGKNLKTILTGSNLIDTVEAIKYFHQLVKALNYLEMNHIIHGDIKP